MTDAESPTPGRGRWRRRLGYAAAAVVLAFLAWALVDGWSQVRRYQWDVDVPLLAASVAVLLVFFATSGLGYVGVVEALAPSPRPSRRAMLRVWATSLLGRYVPGSVLMVVGRLEMGRDHGVARRVSAAALVYEQSLGLGVAAIGSVGFLAAYGAVGSRWAVLAVLAVPVLLVALHPRVFGPLSARALAAVRRPPLERLIRRRDVLALVAWYALTALLLAVGVWLAMRALAGPSVGSAAFVGGAFLFAFTLSMVLIIFPSGLGVRDGAFALALAQHVPQGVAVALSVSCRLLLTVVELVFVGLVVMGTRRR